MAQKGDLLSVRQDIRVVDATIRDGGLCNDFRFDDKFIKALYNANVKAGVDYMEFGYKASKEIFNEEDFGKWKFCNDADIRKIVGDNKTPLKIAVMADVGRTDFKKDIIAKKDSPIDLIRIATYINAIPAAVEMIEDAAKKGYETTINIMAVSKARTEDITAALETLGKTPVNAFYIVDSYGALYPEESRRLADLYCSIADKYGKPVPGQPQPQSINRPREHGEIKDADINPLRNKRDVWKINTVPFKGGHYAAYPPKLVETCLLAGCPEGGIVLDPFMGSGTTGMVASQMGRHFVGIELNPEYTELAYKRIGGEI